jgi:hypothetical protein
MVALQLSNCDAARDWSETARLSWQEHRRTVSLESAFGRCHENEDESRSYWLHSTCGSWLLMKKEIDFAAQFVQRARTHWQLRRSRCENLVQN